MEVPVLKEAHVLGCDRLTLLLCLWHLTTRWNDGLKLCYSKSVQSVLIVLD